MVTPLSQFVGTQAAINVIVGERYKEVTDQTILYALGHWGGQEAIEAHGPRRARPDPGPAPRPGARGLDPPREPTYERDARALRRPRA